MKIFVRIVLGLVVLVIALGVIAYVVVSGYDREELKQIAQTQAKAATGRDLVIAGPLDFTISLSPAITIEDVTFANAAWGSQPHMASMKRFELELAIIPLLTGDIEINRLVLIEPEIFLETDRSGKGNWELDLADAAPEEPAEGGLALAGVNAILIEDARVTYRDGITGEQSAFGLTRLSGSAPSAEILNVEAGGDADGVPFSLDARLKTSGDIYAIENADITYGKSDLTGSGSLAMGGARPKVTAQFKSSLIDLSSVEATGGQEGEPAPAGTGPTGPYVFTTDPLPLGTLRAADAEFTIAVDTIRLSDKADITDAEIALTLANGDLNLTKLKGAAMKGTVDMTARLNASASPARLATRLDVSDLDYGEVLKTMDISEDVDGVINFEVDLQGRGNSMREIAATLSGHEQIVATDGIITNRLLALISSGLGDIMGPLLGSQKDTKLNCFISRFDMANGLATSRALVVDSTTFTIGGDGTVDLRDESLNLSFDTSTRQSALVSLAVPFRIKGTLAEPNAYPDPLGSAKGAAKLARGIGQLLGKNDKEGEGDSKKDPFSSLLGALTGEEEEPPASHEVEEISACEQALRTIGG